MGLVSLTQDSEYYKLSPEDKAFVAEGVAKQDKEFLALNEQDRIAALNYMASVKPKTKYIKPESKIETNPSSRYTPPEEGKIANDLLNFGAGVTGLTRGALNLGEDVYKNLVGRSNGGQYVPAKIASTQPQIGLGDRLLLPKETDKNSEAYQLGTFFDPAAYATGTGVSKILPYAPVLGDTFGQGVKNLTKNIVSGGTTGGIIGGLNDSSNKKNGVINGMFSGAGANVAIPALLKSTSYLGGKFVDALTGNLSKSKAGKIIREFSGNQLQEIKNTLSNNQTNNKTVAEAIASNPKIKKAELIALGEISNKNANPNIVIGAEDKFTTLKNKIISQVSGGETELASIEAQKQAKEALNGKLNPLRIKGSDAANSTTKFIVNLNNEIQTSRAKAEQAVDKVRKLNTAKTKANETALGKIEIGKNPNRYLSGQQKSPVQYSYWKKLENSADKWMQNSADESLNLGASARNAQNQKNILEAHGLSTLSAKPLLDKIDSLASARGDRGISIVTDTLNKFKSHINKSGVIDSNGNIDAYDLHGIRKDLNSIVDSMYPDANESTKSRAVGVLSKLIPTIDDGINAAGGQDLTRYFDLYSKGMNKINRMKMASKISKMTDEEFVNLVNGNDTKSVEDIFGHGNINFNEMMGEDGTKLINISKVIENKLKAKNIGSTPSAIKKAGDILENNMLGFRLPAYLNRTTSTANTVMSIIDERLNENTRKIIMEAMQNPKNTLALINTLPAEERLTAFKILNNKKMILPLTSSYVSGTKENQ